MTNMNQRAATRQPEQTSLFQRIADRFARKSIHSQLRDTMPHFGSRTYVEQLGKPVWSPRDYRQFADEAFTKNVVAYRAISTIAQAAASVPWQLTYNDGAEQTSVKDHPVLRLLHCPNPTCTGASFMENLTAYRMISGNAYILRVNNSEGATQELYLLRPDRVRVIAGKDFLPEGYEYKISEERAQRFPVDRITGQSNILHLKQFNPLNDWYGMSPVEAAAYSIDQHNQAAIWNQALLQNGAKPSGALTVKVADDGSGGTLTDEQFQRIRSQMDEHYSGTTNAGRPLLLEGGLDWKEMSLSPKDMDFIDSKHSSARDIALAFGVPPQLLGIPGDNTYSNLAEARLGLWEQTVLPLLDNITNALNSWLVPSFNPQLKLHYDVNAISALAPRREKIWARVKDADFMSDDEKRAAVGLPTRGE